MMKYSAAALAFALGLSSAACAQETSDPEIEATPVSAEKSSSGFNLRRPDEAPPERTSGFNLAIPGEAAAPGFRMPDNAVSENAFEDLPEVSAEPVDSSEASPDEDEIIRLEP